MTAKRLVVIASMCILALTLMTACDGNSGGNDTAPIAPPASEETPEATAEPEATTEATAEPDDSETPDTSDSSAGGLPEYLTDLIIMLDGDAITLPMPFEDFLSRGWELFSRSAETTLEPEQYAKRLLTKDNNIIGVSVANTLDQASTVQLSSVYGISLTSELTGIFELPLGITLNVSTKEDVIEAYGEPTKISSDSIISYSEEDYKVDFYFDKDSGVIDRMFVDSILLNVMNGFKQVD